MPRFVGASRDSTTLAKWRTRLAGRPPLTPRPFRPSNTLESSFPGDAHLAWSSGGALLSSIAARTLFTPISLFTTLASSARLPTWSCRAIVSLLARIALCALRTGWPLFPSRTD